MGIITSRLKWNQPIEKVLEQFDQQIKDVEARSISRKANWRRWISSILLYAVILEVLYFPYYYFWIYRLPLQPLLKALWSLPFLLIPVLGWLIKTLVNFYYTRRVASDTLFLAELKAKQKAKLEEFARATDFYKTQALMDRYKRTIDEDADKSKSPQKKATGVRQRPVAAKAQSQSGPQQRPRPTSHHEESTPTHSEPISERRPRPAVEAPAAEAPSAPPNPPIVTPRYIMPVPADHHRSPNSAPVPPAAPKDPNRPWYEKLVDYVIGDTNENSVALICEKCRRPAGLAAPNELATSQFKCNSCQHVNLPGSQIAVQNPAPESLVVPSEIVPTPEENSEERETPRDTME